MSCGFLDIMATPGVKAAQAANFSREMWERLAEDRSFDRFTDHEVAFIEARDSFYMASVSQSGWPYVQHRGGPVGFLKMLDEKTLSFADFRAIASMSALAMLLPTIALPSSWSIILTAPD